MNNKLTSRLLGKHVQVIFRTITSLKMFLQEQWGANGSSESTSQNCNTLKIQIINNKVKSLQSSVKSCDSSAPFVPNGDDWWSFHHQLDKKMNCKSNVPQFNCYQCWTSFMRWVRHLIHWIITEHFPAHCFGWSDLTLTQQQQQAAAISTKLW